jgi:hypothetical protein
MDHVLWVGLVIGAVVAMAGLGIAAYAIRKLGTEAPGRLVAVIGALTALMAALPPIFRSLLGF